MLDYKRDYKWLGINLNLRNTGFGGNPEINSTSLASQIGKNFQTDNAGAAAAMEYIRSC
jgi:hypothetical protein